ncbi:mammalian cell entry protein [Mycobacterium florentinum]|uniref:Mammalian cell entry protein n=1 Tax=Mycobacterium florentinum TaxID=292462 RepID=A0A1X1ULD5_MYCFL|nr:virulence factor Mce family protein [Mycobacterium florentinum]MCV7411379.1 virulence factor Mce family protein [Mycobacterium florentinum]ORV57459.1 mammalian cell entry protein [Mycobacterium florentinum]BBX80739.1 Mce family protein Mce3D [Mycobacterium florentinum]
MMRGRRSLILLAALLGIVLVAGIALFNGPLDSKKRVHVVAYFANSNGIFVGDRVRILGVAVGEIEAIEPQPQRAKITFWYDSKYPVPASANAAILAPSLVTARAIQLTPAYSSGPRMKDGSVIPQDRTAVPIEWDDLRDQLAKLTATLQPTQPGGVSTLGAYIDTAADNLRGQGGDLRDTIIKLSQTFSALGEHSGDIFATIRNLAVLVSALHDSTDGMRMLNENLAAATGLLADDPDEIATAVSDLNAAVGDVQSFLSENNEALSTTSQQLASVTTAVRDSLDDIKQTLHVAPTAFSNFLNIYQPAQGSLSGAIALNNFSNPISFLCGAIQAASRLGAEQSAKLCVQYLAPIIKNRQVNFLPIGLNPFVGASARPNELTYSEDWMRPDHIPAPPPAGESNPGGSAAAAPVPVEATATNPQNGLQGIMMPPGVGG